ncbi:hypothetical protein OCU04_007076 [Sclerotinia nivalis]|uniref:Protein kinase domain-containing protein n=1 Tax=Sclerotinia nivalis TaxID=352851 RepID=A0A9X0AL52_9HELO|nr:hypothetical protein OCU04_007076 [Sclerotinia nivalis]
MHGHHDHTMNCENLLNSHSRPSLSLSGPSPPLALTYPLPSSNPLSMSCFTQEFDAVSGPLEFYMGHKKIIATNCDRVDPDRTVYRLTLKKPWIFNNIHVSNAIERLINFLPSLKAIYPQWFLPSIVILKKQKFGWNEEFETEKRMYRYLKPLQGAFIPYFYGEAFYDGSPAFVLSEIRGERLYDSTARPENDDDFLDILEAKLEEAFKGLTKYGVIHGDPTLHNIFEVDDRIMITDLEQAELGSKIWEGNPNNGSVRSLMWDFQACRGGTNFILESNKREMMEMMEYTATNHSNRF